MDRGEAMLVAVDWMTELVGKRFSTDQLASALEKAGIEVENIHRLSEYDAGILIGEVKSVKKHPNADKLNLAQVDIGKGEPAWVVCGAPNLKSGQKVAYAGVGVTLPDGSLLKTAVIRGVESKGMLLSERELGLGMSHSGILVLDDDAKVGQRLSAAIKPTDIIDVKTAANRPDLNGMRAIAREVSAQLGIKFRTIKASKPQPITSPKTIKVSAPKLIKRYSFMKLVIPNNDAPSPSFVRRRLMMAGLRSINFVTDISNYVMLETAQPLHGFDARKIKPPVEARLARAGEKIKTLDGAIRNLSASDIVISDSQQILGIAGVMGSEGSQTDEKSTEICIESANFDAVSVRRSALRHGLRTDASARFERGLPLEFVDDGLAYAAELLVKYGGAKIEWLENIQMDPIAPKPIPVSVTEFSKLAGFTITAPDVSRTLSRLGFEVELRKDTVNIMAPYWRPDVAISADVFEEVIKLVGFDKVKPTLPVWEIANFQIDRRTGFYQQLRATLVGLGLDEVMTYPFVNDKQLEGLGLKSSGHIAIANALTQDQTHLSSNLLANLLTAVAENTRIATEFGMFEIDAVFDLTAKPTESEHLALIIQVQGNAYQEIKSYWDNLSRSFGLEVKLKAIGKHQYYHPARAVELIDNNIKLGEMGEIDPRLAKSMKIQGRLAYLELDMEMLYTKLQQKVFTTIEKIQPLRRDVTMFFQPTVTWQDIREELTSLKGVEVDYISDYYHGGKRALTLRLEITVTANDSAEEAALAALARVESTLAKRFGASAS